MHVGKVLLRIRNEPLFFVFLKLNSLSQLARKIFKYIRRIQRGKESKLHAEYINI